MNEIDPAKRNCYCTLWETNPKILQERHIPYGYCGICDCGELGHLRHAPDGIYTADFCDSCYHKLEILNLVRIGLFVIFFASFITRIWLLTFISLGLLVLTFIWRMLWLDKYQDKLKAQNYP